MNLFPVHYFQLYQAQFIKVFFLFWLIFCYFLQLMSLIFMITFINSNTAHFHSQKMKYSEGLKHMWTKLCRQSFISGPPLHTSIFLIHSFSQSLIHSKIFTECLLHSRSLKHFHSPSCVMI